MTIQEQLKESIGELIPEDKKGDFEQRLAPAFESMTKIFEKYETDTKKMKSELETLKKASGAAPTGVDPRDFEDLQRKLSERESAFEELNSKLSDGTRKLSQTEKYAKELADKYAAEHGALNATLKETELRKAIGLLSLTEGTTDEVYDLLATNVKVSVNDKGVRKIAAVVRDAEGKEVEKPLADYVKDWAATSAVAKRVLAAPRNSGGGATGGLGSVGGPATLQQKYADAEKAGNVALMLTLKAKMASGLTE